MISTATGVAENLPGPPAMVPAGTMVLSKDAQALQLEQGILGPASPIPSPCLLLKNMFNPSECAAPPTLAWLGFISHDMYLLW